MTITTTGIHYFTEDLTPGRKVLLDISGSAPQFNGAAATIGYKGADGEFSPCLKADGTPITITTRGGFELRVPRSGKVGISLSAAPGEGGLTMDVISAVDMPPGS